MMGHQKWFSEKAFWAKLFTQAKAAGTKVVELALVLYYASQTPETPRWAKAVIYSALGYFILPIDALPDPVYVDDFGVLAGALAMVSLYVTPEVKAQAQGKMRDWFGD
jgi:uncharacterized membrane protein YkvA (DUF1232 family)